MNDLIIPQEPTEIAVLFKPQGLDVLLRKIEEEATAFTPDTSTAKGRKEIASQAHKVARSKTLLDNTGKDLAADWKTKIAEIDAERRRAREFLDDLKERVRKPLTEWEAAEELRIAKIKNKIEDIKAAALISQLKNEEITEEIFGEFFAEALVARDERIKILEAEEIIRKQREQEEKEAAERAAKEKAEAEAKAEQERIEREERIALEAAEKARREEQEKAAREKAEAEAKAKAEAERQEREKREALERAEREKQAAIEKAERERAEAIAREEKAKREKLEAEARAKAEAEAAERRIAKAKQDAIEEERKRKEAERLAAEEKQRKAEAAERRKPEEQQLKNFWLKVAPLVQDLRKIEIKDIDLIRKKDTALQYLEGIRTVLTSE